jgi:hypothetical protein
MKRFQDRRDCETAGQYDILKQDIKTEYDSDINLAMVTPFKNIEGYNDRGSYDE